MAEQPLPSEDPATIPAIDDDDDDEDYTDDGDDTMDELDEETNGNSVNVEGTSIPATATAAAAATRIGELTLSFEGEVYVFPDVTHQKVITVHHFQLLLISIVVLILNFRFVDTIIHNYTLVELNTYMLHVCIRIQY
jgi:hypothetical protein